MQELRLRHTGVAHQKDVDVATVASAVFVDLCFTTKELQHERFFDALHTEDGGRNTARKQIVDVFGTSDFFDFRLLFFGDDDFFERDVLALKGMDAQEDVEHRCVLAALSL